MTDSHALAHAPAPASTDALAPAGAAARGPIHTSVPVRAQVAIIGSGFSGLGAAIRLKQEGFDDFVVLERASEVGGTWRDNTYPGCACDVPSHLYSFSFAPNPGWSRAFSPQPEIFSYLRACADRYGIVPHIRFDHAVKNAIWDEDARKWRIETSRGAFVVDVMIGAAGALSEPATPKLRGLEQFQGPAFHSARWDHSVDLTGKRVAVIGTGASAIQFVPEIQPKVAELQLFQRTAPWVLPRKNRDISEGVQSVFRALPAAQMLVRGQIYAITELFGMGFRHPRLLKPLQKLATQYLEKCIPDPVRRAKLTPDYALGCKRILFSNKYLRALGKDNVDVVTDGIQEIRPHSIVTNDGREREVDAIVFGTGFHVTDIPFGKYVTGRDGLTLDDVWKGSPQAHLGTTVAGFPNFFFLLGPNTGLGHTSVVYMIESQIAHVVSALRYMRDRRVGTVEVRPEAQAAFIADVDRRLGKTVWNTGGCNSWYIDKTGRNSTLWPDATWRFRRRVRNFDPSEYELDRPAARAASRALPVDRPSVRAMRAAASPVTTHATESGAE
ncbi:MAG TPA: NAD(P)/FAD-dependent oxidoreductase [Polyangiaceae bacterium]|nr:NAD(P)/FAD-dependent oxidoreductase [Polyangiaceae bacterium]